MQIYWINKHLKNKRLLLVEAKLASAVNINRLCPKCGSGLACLDFFGLVMSP